MVDSNADTLLKSKATPQNKETIEENPYNQKKDYIDYEQEEANKKETFQDANSIAVKKDQPKVVVDSMQSLDEPQEDTPEKTEDKPYSKVDYKKRYDDLKKLYDGRVNTFKAREEELLAEVRSNRPKYKAPKSPDELAAFKKEYPDVYEMVETIAMNKADTRAKEMETKYQNLQVQQEQINREKAEVELLKAHPDYKDIRQKDEFHEWAAKQDPTIQGWLYENTSNASLAGRAIDLYKMDTGISKLSKKEEKAVKKEAAKAITKTAKATETELPKKKVWSNAAIAKMTVNEYAKYEEEIDKAVREGRIQP